MIKFYDENGQAHFGQATIKRTQGVNGSLSLSGVIFDGEETLTKLDRGWWLNFDNEKYVVTYKKLNDVDRTVEFDAIQEFFWDFSKTALHEQLNGSHEFEVYLNKLFSNSGYKFNLDIQVAAFEKENWGYKNKLDLFNDVIQQAGVEFEVHNEIVHITKQVGDDLTSFARKGINLSDLTEEMKISDFVTYGKGYGAFKDENDHDKGRLEVEYESELSKKYGRLELDPIVDERYKIADNLVAAIKEKVDASYSISVTMNIHDLETAGYPKYQSPQIGDWLLAIDEALNFKRRIRIIKLEEDFDATGKRVGYVATCGDLSAAEQYQNAQGDINNRIDDITNQIDDVATSADGKNSNYYGDTEPSNPNEGDLWFDTSSSDSNDWIIYQWHNGRWEKITPSQNEISDEVNDQLSGIQDAIDDARNAVDIANGKIDDFNNSLININGDIATAKSDAANALNNITVIDSKLTQLSDDTTARINTLSNGYQFVLDEVNNLDVGGRNYLLNSDVTTDVFKRLSLSTKTSYFSGKKIAVSVEIEIKNVKSISSDENNRVGYEAIWVDESGKYYYPGTWKVFTNDDIGKSFKLRIGNYFDFSNVTFKDNDNNECGALYVQGISADLVKIGKPKLEIGTKVTDWTPAPEDLAKETEITVIQGLIDQKVSNDQYQSDKTQTANLISQTVSSAIDGLKIGGTNLVPNSGMMASTKGWNTTGTLITTTHPFYHNGQDPIFRLSNTKGGTTTETVASNAVRFPVKRNTNYTMSVITFATSNTINIDLYFLGRIYGSKNDFDKSIKTVSERKVSFSEAEYITATFNTGDLDEGYFRIDNNGTTNGKQTDVYFTEVKVEEGTKATPWSPAVSDLATETELDQTNEALKLTAKQSDMTKALNSITTLTETATGLQTQVNSKASQSQVTQLADQYQAVVGSLTGSSLVLNSGYPQDTRHWTVGGGAKNTFRVATHVFYHNGKENTFNLVNQGGQPNLECYVSSTRFSVKPNTQYTLSIKGFASSNVTSMDIFFLGRKYNSTASIGYDKAIQIINQKKLSPSKTDSAQATFNTGECEEGYIRIDNNGSLDGKDSSLYFTEVQVNPGTIALPWSMPTLTQTDVTASINNIHLGVKSADGSTSTFNMNNNTILMDANKIILNGNVSIKDGTIGTAKISSLSADKITAGTLNASKVNVVNINAANITTGTVKGASLSINLNNGQVVFQHGRIHSTSNNVDINIDNGYLSVANSNNRVMLKNGEMQFVSPNYFDVSNDPYFSITNGGSGLAYTGARMVGREYVVVSHKTNADNVFDLPFGKESFAGLSVGYSGGYNPTKIGGADRGVIISGGGQMSSNVDLFSNSPNILVGVDAQSSFNHNRIMLNGQYVHAMSTHIHSSSGSANVIVAADGALVSTKSASKYKLNINKLTDREQAHALLSINAKTWYDKFETESIAKTMTEGHDENSFGNPKLKPYLGFIAEDFANAGLEMLVTRDKNGELESINYDRISALEHLNVQELFSRVLQLEKEVYELRSENNGS